MNNSKIFFQTKFLNFVLAMVLILTIGFIGHSQPIVGMLVNAVLVYTTLRIGLSSSIFIGLVPSILALSMGLILPSMVFMIPFIMFANALFVSIFSFVKKYNDFLGVFVGSLFKFIFLYFISSYFLSRMSFGNVENLISYTFGFLQFATAFFGGSLGIIIYRVIHKS